MTESQWAVALGKPVVTAKPVGPKTEKSRRDRIFRQRLLAQLQNIDTTFAKRFSTYLREEHEWDKAFSMAQRDIGLTPADIRDHYRRGGAPYNTIKDAGYIYVSGIIQGYHVGRADRHVRWEA